LKIGCLGCLISVGDATFPTTMYSAFDTQYFVCKQSSANEYINQYNNSIVVSFDQEDKQ